MITGLWILGAILVLDGILLAWLKRRGTLAFLPAFIPLLSLATGVAVIIAAFFANR